MRVFLPKIEGTLAHMFSGAVYRITNSGWIRLNHPKNEYQRKHEAVFGRDVKPHRT